MLECTFVGTIKIPACFFRETIRRLEANECGFFTQATREISNVWNIGRMTSLQGSDCPFSNDLWISRLGTISTLHHHRWLELCAFTTTPLA